MPEDLRRAQPKEADNRVPPLPSQTFDFVTLTEQEEFILQAVLQKDDLERKITDTKICELRKEIQEIRKASALTDGDNQKDICARCKLRFSPVLLPWADHGQRCVTCKFKVCTRCCIKQVHGTWLCILCFKYRQEQLLTGEWMSRGQSTGIDGSQLLKALLRDKRRVPHTDDETKGVNYTQRPARSKDPDCESRTSRNSQSSFDNAELQKEKSSAARAAPHTSMASSQNCYAIHISTPAATNQSRFSIKSSGKGRAEDDKENAEHQINVSTAESSNELCVAGTSSNKNASDLGEMCPTHQCSELRSRGSVQRNPSTASRSSHKRSKGHMRNVSSVIDTFNLPILPGSNLNRRKSISEQTLYYDDVKLVAHNLKRLNSHQGRSNSALSSEFGIIDKNRSLKPTSETSELEMFRKRGERYSLKKKKTQEKGTNEDKSLYTVNTDNNSSPKPAEKQIRLHATNSWNRQQSRNLYTKSRLEIITIQGNCCLKSASFPSLSVIQSDDSPFCVFGQSQRRTEIQKDPNSSVLNIFWNEVSAPSVPTAQAAKRTRKEYTAMQTHRSKSSSAPDLFSVDIASMLHIKISNTAKVLSPNPGVKDVFPESTKNDSCCSAPFTSQLVGFPAPKYQISSASRPNRLDLTSFKFQISPASSPKRIDPPGSKFQMFPASSPKRIDPPGSKFQISPVSSPKRIDSPGSKIQMSPASSPKRIDSPGSKFQISPASSPKRIDSPGSKFQISPTSSPKRIDSPGSKIQMSPASSPKRIDSPGSKIQMSPASSPKRIDSPGSKFQISPVSTPRAVESPVSRFRQSHFSSLRHSISSPEEVSSRSPRQPKVLRSRSDVSSSSFRWQTVKGSGYHGSRCRSLSQFRGLRDEEKLSRLENAEDEDEARLSERQGRDLYSQKQKSQKCNVNFGKGNISKPHWWQKASQPNQARHDIITSRHNPEVESEVSSLTSCITDSQLSSRDTNNDSSEDTRSGKSLHKQNSIVQQARRIKGMPAVLPRKFQFRRSSSTLQNECPDKDSSNDDLSKGEKVGSMAKSKTKTNILQFLPGNSKRSAIDTKIRCKESDYSDVSASTDEDCKTKHTQLNRKNHIKIAPLRRGNNRENISSDEDSRKKTVSKKRDTQEQASNSNVNHTIQSMTEIYSTTSLENTRSSPRRTDSELPQISGKGKDISLSKSLAISDKERHQSLNKGSGEKSTGNDFKVRVYRNNVVEEKLLLPSEIKKSQNPFGAKAASAKTTPRFTELSTPNIAFRKGLSISTEEINPKILRRAFSEVPEATAFNKAMEDVDKPHIRVWTHVPHEEYPELYIKSQNLSDSSEPGDSHGFKDHPDVIVTQDEHDSRAVLDTCKVNIMWSGSDVSDTVSILTEMSEPGRGAADCHFDLDRDDTLEDPRFNVSFSYDNDDRTDLELSSLIFGKANQIWNVDDCSTENIAFTDSGSDTSSMRNFLRLSFDDEDSGIKSADQAENIRDAESINEAGNINTAVNINQAVVRKDAKLIINEIVGSNKAVGLDEVVDINDIVGSNKAVGLEEAVDINEIVGSNKAVGLDEAVDINEIVGSNKAVGLDEAVDINEIDNINETVYMSEHNEETLSSLQLQVNYGPDTHGLDTSSSVSNEASDLHTDKDLVYSAFSIERLDKDLVCSAFHGEKLEKELSFSAFPGQKLDNGLACSAFSRENLDNDLVCSAYPKEEPVSPKQLNLKGKIVRTGIWVNWTSSKATRMSVETTQNCGKDKSLNFYEMIDDEVDKNNLGDQCPISTLIDSAGRGKSAGKPTLLYLAMKNQEMEKRSSAENFRGSNVPKGTEDLAARGSYVNQRLDRENDKGGASQRESYHNHESPKDTDSGITSGSTTRTNTPEQRGLTYRSISDQSSVPHISVTNIRGESFKEEDDDLDELFNNRHPNQFLGSRSSLADSRESIYSCYSDAGEVNYGRIAVTGEIMFNIAYDPKGGILKVHVKQCRDLAPVDIKHNRSDPYVKVYLLPDKTRGSKRKTRIKKHTLNPVFDEVLKYQINSAELESRSLWLTVWHNDRLGRNDFLGEVTIALDYHRFDENIPTWYPLQERAVTQEPVMFYKGDLLIALKYVPADMVEAAPKKKPSSFRKKTKEKEKSEPEFGEVHVLVREAQNLTAMRASAGSNPFCKGYLLPDVSHTSKQKTPVIRKTTNPQWQHILVFEGVVQSELYDYGLELTIWDHEKLSSNDFLGGVRLNLGYGTHKGKPVDWMDANGEEIEAWQAMIDHPNEWIDASLPLRASMGKQSVKK